MLDEPVGKNDGSVAGVRYFQCEMKRGVFSRIAKISREPVTGGIRTTPTVTPAPTPSGDVVPPRAKTPTEPVKLQPETNGTVTPPQPAIGPQASKMSSLQRAGTVSGSQSNLKATPSGSSTNLIENKFNLKVGDRVLVSGTKPGVLRYIGTTEFANGNWAGVELDDPLGKNDGSVAGKR